MTRSGIRHAPTVPPAGAEATQRRVMSASGPERDRLRRDDDRIAGL